MKSIRRRLSYANITATLALFFALSGGALAASHYLITSKKQISPKVLKQLKGAKGPKGATGPAGPAGAAGAAGAAGPAGTAAAYAEVLLNSLNNPELHNNNGFTSVKYTSKEGLYYFCIAAPGGNVSVTPVVSPVGAGYTIAQYSPQDCSTGEWEFGVSTALANGQGFSIVVP